MHATDFWATDTCKVWDKSWMRAAYIPAGNPSNLPSRRLFRVSSGTGWSVLELWSHLSPPPRCKCPTESFLHMTNGFFCKWSADFWPADTDNFTAMVPWTWPCRGHSETRGWINVAFLQPNFVRYNLVALLEALCAQIFFLESGYRTCLYESEIWTGPTLNSTIIALSVPSTGFLFCEVNLILSLSFCIFEYPT